MAINFPNSPTDGQVFTDPTSGNQYVYSAALTRWNAPSSNSSSSSSSTSGTALGLVTATTLGFNLP